MAPPTRPVSGASIASVWGQQVHDYTFAPAGCDVAGAGVVMLASAATRTLPIDTAAQDPGGYMDAGSNRLEVPTDGEGLYLIVLRASTINGATTDETRVFIQVNGSPIGVATIGNEGGTTLSLPLVVFADLDVGDLITVHGYQAGSGARATVGITSLAIVRLGAEFGAP